MLYLNKISYIAVISVLMNRRIILCLDYYNDSCICYFANLHVNIKPNDFLNAPIVSSCWGTSVAAVLSDKNMNDNRTI